MARRVFLSYAAIDEPFRAELEKHLAPLRREAAAVVWDDHQVVAGEERRAALEAQLDAADVILLLVTADLLASEELHHEQVQRALARAPTSGARVVPVLVRPCVWRLGALAELQPLPRNGNAVTSWANRDEAWVDVVEGVLAAFAEAPARANAGAAMGGRVTWVFVGREKELAALRAALLPSEGAPRSVAICALYGMAGVGKSYLADRFAAEHADRFPGGAVRLVLEPGEDAQAPSVDALFTAIARQLGLPERPDPKPIAARLRSPRALLHIENADSFATAGAAARVADSLSPAAILVTGRYREMGRMRFVQVDVAVFAPAQSLELLEQQMGQPIATEERPAFTRLAAALGHLPLALSLAADYLREGYTPDAFLELLRAQDFDVAPLDPAHSALLGDQARAIVGRAFELSIGMLRCALGKDAERMIAGFLALGHAPAAGFGVSLGAAIAGLGERDFLRMATTASLHSLLDRVAGTRARWTLHPLIAEMGRRRSDGKAALGRMTDWFVDRLDPAIDTHDVAHGPRWAEIRTEVAALTAWLPVVPEADLSRTVIVASRFAIREGPFDAWQRFCERALGVLREPNARSHALFVLVHVAQKAGDLDRAFSAAQEKVAFDCSQGWLGYAANATSKMADILALRGTLDDALRLLREEVLPVYEALADVRSRAMVVGHLASILESKGELAEALRIRRQEELPVFKELGDVRQHTLTLGGIADNLGAQGELTEALRIRREEVQPLLESLGEARHILIGRWHLARLLLKRNVPGDREEAALLLRLARDAAERLRIPEAAEIRELQVLHGVETA
jgi:hypothetical protein